MSVKSKWIQQSQVLEKESHLNPARFTKETAMEFGAIFNHLFCQSYQHGTLPSHWTHALACPVYKKARNLRQ